MAHAVEIIILLPRSSSPAGKTMSECTFCGIRPGDSVPTALLANFTVTDKQMFKRYMQTSFKIYAQSMLSYSIYSILRVQLLQLADVHTDIFGFTQILYLSCLLSHSSDYILSHLLSGNIDFPLSCSSCFQVTFPSDMLE